MYEQEKKVDLNLDTTTDKNTTDKQGKPSAPFSISAAVACGSSIVGTPGVTS